GQQIVRVLDGVVRDTVATERGAIGRPKRLVADGLVGDARPYPERPGPLVHELTEAARLETADEGDLAPLLALDEALELGDQRLLRLVPLRRLARDHGAAIAIGMIEPLQRRLASDAQGACVHGMVGIALELDDAAVTILGEHAAAAGTLAAHGGEIGSDPGDDAVGRHDIWDELLGYRADQLLGVVAAAARRHGGAGRRHDPEERSAIDAAHGRLPGSCIVKGARRGKQHCECRRTGTTSSPTIYARALLARHRAR